MDDGDYVWFLSDGKIDTDLNLKNKRHDPIEFNLTKKCTKISNNNSG
jgi:hypothetical protein